MNTNSQDTTKEIREAGAQPLTNTNTNGVESGNENRSVPPKVAEVGGRKTDEEIAAAVLSALQSDVTYGQQDIIVKVEGGVVRLEGEVEWDFQRIHERTTIENLAGVRAVINLITVKPKSSSTEVIEKISAAFHERADLDAAKITAEVIGSRVTLHGMVRSESEKEVAEAAAWNAPGITNVESMLEIAQPEFGFYVD